MRRGSFDDDDEITSSEKREYSSSFFRSGLEIDPKEMHVYEELTKENKSITGLNELFDGFKFIFNKGISEHIAVNHSIGLGSAMDPATYSLGTNFSWKNLMLWGQVDTDGRLFGKYHHAFNGERTVLKLTGQASFEPHGSGLQVELDHKGSNWSSQFRWVNPGTYGIAFLQYITKSLCIGTDLHYIHKQSVTVPSVAVRYTPNDTTIWACILAPHITNITFTRILGRVGLSTDLSFNMSQNGWEPQWSVGYEYRLTMSLFRGHVDSSGRVCGMLEEQLNQFTKFSLNGDLDYAKNQYKFGLGIQLQL